MSAEEGYSAVWDLRELDDQLELFSPLRTSLGTRDGLIDITSASPNPTQLPLRWEIRPDDPDTPVDELSINLFSTEILGPLYTCAGAACPVRFEPGDRLVAYMGGAIEDYVDVNPRADAWQILDLWNADSPGRAFVEVERVCN